MLTPKMETLFIVSFKFADTDVFSMRQICLFIGFSELNGLLKRVRTYFIVTRTSTVI